MEWHIKHIFNFTAARPWANGYCGFGFHGKGGTQYLLHYTEHWLGCLTSDDEFTWTAGATDKGLSQNHIPLDVKHPHYLTELPDSSLLVSSGGTNKIYRLWPATQSAELFLDAALIGMKDVGNCVYDGQGHVWVNEIEGCRVWELNLSGEPILTLGSGRSGYQQETVPFDAALFSWIYDLRLGPDGNVYVLDSKNFSVRQIDVEQHTVSTVAGSGKPGYSGDGGPATEATLGSNPDEHFDGPFALSIDEEGNLFIGDTCNHVVRMIDHATGQIATIAGKHDVEPGARNNPLETDPLNLNLPKIGSMDYYGGCIFVPDWNNDLIVLEKR